MNLVEAPQPGPRMRLIMLMQRVHRFAIASACLWKKRFWSTTRRLYVGLDVAQAVRAGPCGDVVREKGSFSGIFCLYDVDWAEHTTLRHARVHASRLG